MYNVTITVGSKSIVMSPTTGILISTIVGFTGGTADFKTTQSTYHAGEDVSEAIIKGKTLQFQGKILDGFSSAAFSNKRQMLSLLLPATEVEVQFTPRRSGSPSVAALYGHAIVKTAPTMTQETHSKFAFELYFPDPFLHLAAVSGAIPENGNHEFNVAGEYDPEYELTATTLSAGRAVEYLRLELGDRYMYLDFTKLPAGGLSDGRGFHLYRQNGKLMLDILPAANSGVTRAEDGIACVDIRSTLWRLPRGVQTIAAISGSSGQTAGFTAAGITLTYTPLKLCDMISES